MATLTSLGVTARVEALKYTAAAPVESGEVVEGYLQRCLFDDGLSLAQMLADQEIGSYLETCRDGGGWGVEQDVRLIFFEAGE